MAHPTTPAQMRKAYADIKALQGVDAGVLSELEQSYTHTNGFTDAGKCAELADNMALICDLAGLDFRDAPVANADRSGSSATGSDPRIATLPAPLFKKGDRVHLLSAKGFPKMPNGAEMDCKRYAGKFGTVEYVRPKYRVEDDYATLAAVPGDYGSDWFPILKFDDGTESNSPIPEQVLIRLDAKKSKKEKKSKESKKGKGSQSAAKPAFDRGALGADVAAMDDEQCRALVRDNNRKAREAREEAELAEYKAAQLKAGKSEEEVAALTYRDLKKRRTITDITKAPTERLVHNISRHLATKSKALKDLPDTYDEMRTRLEAQAAEKVAAFARQQAQWVNESLESALSKADEAVKATN